MTRHYRFWENLTVRRLGYKLGLRLRQIRFIRGAIDDHADLHGMDRWTIFRCFFGLAMLGISNLICWPLIGVLSTMSLHEKKPMIAAVGGPTVYAVTFICSIIGMAMAGGKFARVFLRYRARVWAELLLKQGEFLKPETRNQKSERNPKPE
jgi:hypothetical protein